MNSHVYVTQQLKNKLILRFYFLETRNHERSYFLFSDLIAFSRWNSWAEWSRTRIADLEKFGQHSSLRRWLGPRLQESRINNEEPIQTETLIHELFAPRKATYLISSLQKFDTCPIIVKLSTLDTVTYFIYSCRKKKNVRNFLKCKNWRVKSNFPFDTVIRYEFQSNKSQFALHRKLIEIFLTLAACTPLYIQWRDLNPLWKY